MHYWRGVITHLSILLAQPTYLALRYISRHDFAYSPSVLNLFIHAVVWSYIALRISVPFFTSPLRLLPSPPGERFLLCHLNFNGGRPPTTIFEDMINNTPNDGIIVLWGPLYLFHEVLVTRPDTAMEVLNAHSYDWHKPSVLREVLLRILGEGLVNVEGAKHKAMRRVVAPSFTGRQVRDQAPLFYAKGLALADVVARRLGQNRDGELDMMALASSVSLDIIGAAAVGMEFNTLNDEQSHLAKLYQSVAEPPPFSLLVQVLFPKWMIQRVKGSGFAATLNAQSQLRDKIHALLTEKKIHMYEDESASQSKDIIASIMKAGDFSEDYLMGQMLTFLTAGHDTGASALTWAMWLLSLHPQVADRLRLECNTQIGDKSPSEISASIFDNDKMPFLTAVCNEVLRLYPPAPNSPRDAAVPTTIGHVCIPKGTRLTVSSWAINRSRAIWGPDAAEFKPERWLHGPNAANGGAESPHAFLTFLHGPRACIGQSFARLEMKCLVAVLMMRFHFEVAEPDRKIEIGGFVTIKPHGGLKFKVRDIRNSVDGAQR
ncbi:hypothetical protein PV10_03534 [Exophiala mesophila]|uniref:Cytochrome P450 monooxygenase n=1 Tax=Exophiala mesophila TaxID=212818 RepID=A0A0D2AAJ7_EXOME|nr:uncharacterized protein PV10_03534 [Exophiala mesophila]KIV95943.1 hypothetical protein PV10_03534 [Exophiala mesophila]